MSAVIRMGSNTPVEAFPPKIMAITGTINMETPGTPVLDIPARSAHMAIRAHWVYDIEKLSIKAVILLIFWFEWF
jgi:hypothetical protein